MIDQAGQQRFRFGLDNKEIAMNRANKAFGDGAINPSHQRVKIAGDIQQTDGFLLNTQLIPGERFKEFIQRAIAARQDNIGI